MISSARAGRPLYSRFIGLPAPVFGDRLQGIAYGGDYNPEQWPEEVWIEDVRLMQEAGVNLVSLGIFSWARIQPVPDAFELDWLDRVMDLLHQGGIRVDLATATASPPPWLSHRHPDMLPQLADGVRLWPGSRQHYCPSSPVYREAARALVSALAERYSRHPALVLWHCGNEYGCHVPACWCDTSARHFRVWLHSRYGTIEELNRAWGTEFWSQRYSDWEEILPPRRAPAWPNPGQQLDFHRFCSDALLECFQAERAVLAKLSPGVPVTTNFMGFYKPIDYWKWAEREDIVSNDSYPDPGDPESPMRAAMAGDLARSLGQGRPWILMEQTPNRVNWRPVNVAKAPGQMRLWSLQAVARGADGVMFFQWRQSRAGVEKFHSAMVPHGPPASSPAWREVVGLGKELRELQAVRGASVPAEVALIHDWESWWALELPSKPSSEVTLVRQLEDYYRPLHEANIPTDFAAPGADLGRYRAVLVPNLYLVGDDAARNLTEYVRAGGTLVMSFFSGIVDEREQVRLGGYPAPFKELLGIVVDDFLPLVPGSLVELRLGDGSPARADTWSELVTPTTAEVFARFAGGVLDGHPAITCNLFGEGRAYYLATRLAADPMAALLRRVWTEAGCAPVLETPAGIEAVRRTSSDRSWLFLLNHGEEAVDVVVPGQARKSITLGPKDAVILDDARTGSRKPASV